MPLLSAVCVKKESLESGLNYFKIDLDTGQKLVVPSCWNFICICYTVCLVYVAIPLYYWLTAKKKSLL